MSTDTLELIELDIDWDAVIPCHEHEDRAATHMAKHGNCHTFDCAECAKKDEDVVIACRAIRFTIKCTVCNTETNPWKFEVVPI